MEGDIIWWRRDFDSKIVEFTLKIFRIIQSDVVLHTQVH